MQDRADAGKRVRHHAEQGAIAQPEQRAGGDAFQEIAHFVAREHGRFAAFDGMLGAADGMRRVGREHLAGDQPVEEHADRGEVLLDGRPRARLAGFLHPSGDMHGLHVSEVVEAVAPAPGRELARGLKVGAAGMVVGDVGGEELPEAALRAGIREEKRGGSGRAERGGFPALDFREKGDFGIWGGNLWVGHGQQYT